MSAVKIRCAALDEAEGGEIILRGVVAPESLGELQVGDYQREVLPISQISELVRAFETSSVPDIELGMRGERCREMEPSGYHLLDPVFIIDGLQRVSAAIHMMKQGKEKLPHVGVVVHFNTTEEWERERFRILNMLRNKLSPNVLLRNLANSSPAVEVLHRLTTGDKSFVLYDRVSWNQRMRRQDLLGARLLVQAVSRLHARFGPTGHNLVDEMATGLNTVMTKVGKNTFRDNVRTFFDLIETCWGLRLVRFKEGACWIRGTYLNCLAKMLAEHGVFWKGNALFVSRDWQRKIALFPVNDPEVRNLSSAGGKARELLYHLMINHVNSGRRTNRLVDKASKLERGQLSDKPEKVTNGS